MRRRQSSNEQCFFVTMGNLIYNIRTLYRISTFLRLLLGYERCHQASLKNPLYHTNCCKTHKKTLQMWKICLYCTLSILKHLASYKFQTRTACMSLDQSERRNLPYTQCIRRHCWWRTCQRDMLNTPSRRNHCTDPQGKACTTVGPSMRTYPADIVRKR